jgi:hypothetical protein
MIRQLVDAADERIIIMPGSGVRKENILELSEKTGASEFHSSVRSKKRSESNSIMILRDEILKERSKLHALKIADYACASKKNFRELMKCFLDNEYRLAQRAAWSVSWAARKKPEMIGPHFKELVSVLHKKNVHDAVTRNAVRVLQDVDIPEKFHGDVMTAVFSSWNHHLQPLPSKYFR